MLKYLYGTVAEWLRSGLQNRVHRFNSGRCLQFIEVDTAVFRKNHYFGSIISLSPNGGIGIRVRLKIEWRNPYGFKSHFGHQQIFPKYLTLCQISVKLKQYASLAQLFRALPCQGRGRELESLSSHQMVFLLIRLFRAYFYLLLISIKPVVFSPLVFSFPWGTNALFF